MNKYIKYFALVLVGGVAFWALRPASEELRAFLLLIATECVALGLCFLSYFMFNKQAKKQRNLNGTIFLGVHICLGLSMLSVYIAQWNI